MRLEMLKTLALVLTMIPGMGQASDILTVTAGEISRTYSFDDLSAFPQEVVVTDNFYVDEPTRFSGPLLRDLMEAFGVTRENTLVMTAINDYSAEIPVTDILDYDVILALRENGEPMPVREKGPIWVIYPMDDHAELSDPLYNSRLIWQLSDIRVE